VVLLVGVERSGENKNDRMKDEKRPEVKKNLWDFAVQTLFCLFRRLRPGLHTGRVFFLGGGEALGGDADPWPGQTSGRGDVPGHCDGWLRVWWRKPKKEGLNHPGSRKSIH